MIKELIYHQSKDTNIYPNWFKSLLLEIQDLNKIKDKIFKKTMGLTPLRYRQTQSKLLKEIET